MRKFFFFLFLFPFIGHAQIITTIAGGDSVAYSGDGGPAISAGFGHIKGLTIDGRGNVYVADGDYSRVRKIGLDGIINTVAGNGISGWAGDNDSAVHANIANPTYIAADSIGNLYIYDAANYVVRKVDTATIIHSVAGNGLFGDMGDYGLAWMAAIVINAMTVDDTGNIYLTIQPNHRIRTVRTAYIQPFAGVIYVSGYTGDGGPALGAQMNMPLGIFADKKGRVLICDTYNNSIREVDTAKKMHTLAGSVLSMAGFSGDGGLATAALLDAPTGVTEDGDGNIYVTDYNNQRIRKINHATGIGIIHTICGNGTASFSGDDGFAVNATINNATDICVDAVHNVYFLDKGNNRIRKISGITGNYAICMGVNETLSCTTGGTWSSSDPGIAAVGSTGIVSPVATGTATITFTKNGLIATAPVTVNAAPAPITGITNACDGVAITLSDATAGGTWTSSNTSIATIGSSSGVYTGIAGGTCRITYTLPTGCRTTVTLTLNPLPPTPAVISGPNAVCQYDSVHLVDPTPGGTWSSSNTSVATISTAGWVTGMALGSVYISYTKTNSCGSSYRLRLQFVQSCTLETAMVERTTGSLSIYPDPASSTLNIVADSKIDHIVIVDPLGRIVYDRDNYSNKAKVDVSGLSKGIYYISIDGFKSGKFLKE